MSNRNACWFDAPGALVSLLALLGCTGILDGSGAPGTPGGPTGMQLGPAATGGSAGAGGDASSGLATVGPSSGRRLTKREYLQSVLDLLGVDLSGPDDAGALPDDQPPTGAGFRNDVAGLLPTALRTDAYEALATAAAERAPWAGGLAAHASCADGTPACQEGFLRHLGRLLYRRALSSSDVANLLPLFGEASSFEAGARLVLRAMLQSPHFLYRLERLDQLDAATGRAAPSAYELATRLSYLAWQSAPTPELLAAAERGELSGAGYDATVKSLLGHAHAERGFQGYADDWLQLYRLEVRTPNEERGVTPALLGEMKQEVLRFVTRVAFTEQRDLSQLLTDKKTEVGPALASVYGVAARAPGLAALDLSADPNRVGILTQPGFMILRAAPDRVTIVHRGLMVLRVFLCSEVPAPPADAATQGDSIPQSLTDRDRFALHASAPTCKGCHSVFDPLGYPFEPYDLAGRFRTQDEFGNALRSDGSATLDGESRAYASTAEFASVLAQSPSVQRCFVQKLFQYGLGRTLGDADQAALDDLSLAFQSGGRSYAAAFEAVASSSAFRALAPNQ